MAYAANIIGIWEKLQSARLSVDQKRCVVVRNRNAKCRRCAEACTTGCISVERGQLSVEASKCIGCGTCSTVCPAEAIVAHEPDDEELLEACALAARKAKGCAVVACEKALERCHGALDQEKVVGVTCLGRVDECLALRLSDEDVLEMDLLCGDCASCALVHGRTVAQFVADTANSLLEAWGRSLRVRLTDRFPSVCRCSKGVGYDKGRRDAFAALGRDAGSIAAAAIDASWEEGSGAVAAAMHASVVTVGEDGTLPHFIPSRRVNMLNKLRTWERPENSLIETRLWGNVVVDARRCQSCRMCAVFCPSGALEKAEKGINGFFGLLHTPAICVRCGTCESLCPSDAIVVCSEVFTDDVADGAVEAIELPEPAYQRVGPQSAMHAMRDVLGCKSIYER